MRGGNDHRLDGTTELQALWRAYALGASGVFAQRGACQDRPKD